MRSAKRAIAGLLVLAILLLSGAQTSMMILPDAHHRGTPAAGQIIATANHGMTTPSCEDDCDHGLACCIGSQCLMHACWISARSATVARRPRLPVVYLSSLDLSLPGIAARPAFPPPRTAV